MENKKYLLAFDLGGTNIKYGIILDHKLVHFDMFDTPKTDEEFFTKIKKIHEKLNERYKYEKIVVSAPGSFDFKTKKINFISAIPYIHENNFLITFKKIFNLPIAVENDANCAAIAEHNLGKARNISNFVMITLGTGVGGGVFINNQLYKGHTNKAGEFGLFASDHKHIILDALSDLEKEFLGPEKKLVVINETNDQKPPKTPEDYMNGLLIITLSYALIIFNAQISYDPELILLGGGLSHMKSFVDNIKEALDLLLDNLTDNEIKIKLQVAKFQNKAGLIGASFLKDF